MRLLACAATLGALVAAVVFAGALALAATPTSTDYAATPTSGFNFTISPQEIAAGPDGNVWYTDGGSDVYKMIASAPNIGQTTGYQTPAVGSDPTGIVAADGALWFTENASTTGVFNIGCVTTSGTISEFPVPTQSTNPGLDGITLGPDGALWFTESAVNQIGRAMPSKTTPCTLNGEITEYDVPGATIGQTGGGNAATSADSIASGPGGNLWFTEAGSERIGEMSTSGTVVGTFPTPPATLSESPFGIVEGSDGNMWFTNPNSGDHIGRVTAAGKITEFALPAYGGSLGIVSGPDGNLWFTYAASGSDVGVGCVTPAGNAFKYPDTNTSAGGPEGITVGDGAIWFTEPAASYIGRLAPVVCNATVPPPKTFAGSYVFTYKYVKNGVVVSKGKEHIGFGTDGRWTMSRCADTGTYTYNPTTEVLKFTDHTDAAHGRPAYTWTGTASTRFTGKMAPTAGGRFAKETGTATATPAALGACS